MADIHVLTGIFKPSASAVYKSYAMHYYIPSASRSSSAASDPALAAFTSAVPDILGYEHPDAASLTELDAIREGAVVEEVHVDKYHTWDDTTTVKQRIVSVYDARHPQVVAAYVERYRKYGAAFSAS